MLDLVELGLGCFLLSNLLRVSGPYVYLQRLNFDFPNCDLGLRKGGLSRCKIFSVLREADTLEWAQGARRKKLRLPTLSWRVDNEVATCWVDYFACARVNCKRVRSLTRHADDFF